MTQLVLNKLALSLWCARGCCFVFNCSYFSSSKTLPKAGHHLPSNTECKTVPFPNRWCSQYVLEAKGRMQWSKGVMQQGSSSQTFIRLMAKWRLEVGFPGTVACTHFSSHPRHHICTFVICPLAHGKLCVWGGCLSTSFLNTSHQLFSLSGYHLTNIHMRTSPAQPSKRRSNLNPGLTP